MGNYLDIRYRAYRLWLALPPDAGVYIVAGLDRPDLLMSSLLWAFLWCMGFIRDHIVGLVRDAILMKLWRIMPSRFRRSFAELEQEVGLDLDSSEEIERLRHEVGELRHRLSQLEERKAQEDQERMRPLEEVRRHRHLRWDYNRSAGFEGWFMFLAGNLGLGGIVLIDSQAPRRYSLGDTARIGFELRDETGVGSVVANFIPDEGTGESILLRGDGEGAKRATVRLEGEIEENHTPGKYRLHYLQATDTAGNTSLHHPQQDPHFYVDSHPGDSEGPQYEAWGFLD